MLPVIPEDKANHIIYGACVAGVTLAICAGVKRPDLGPLSGLSAAFIAGCLGELSDWWNNRKATKAGLPAAHSVDPEDIVATVIGGVFVAAVSVF